MSNLVISDALPSDLEALVALTQATHDEHAAHSPDRFTKGEAAQTIKWFQSHFASRQTEGTPVLSRVLVCRDLAQIENTFVGHVLLVFWNAAQGTAAYDRFGSVYDISVIPARRGEGIGRKLLEKARHVFQSESVTVAVAAVWRGNLASEGLFEGAGYQAVAKEYSNRLHPPIKGAMPDKAAPRLHKNPSKKSCDGTQIIGR